MSFEAAWGFDPEKALKAQQLFQKSTPHREDALAHEGEDLNDSPDARIPSSGEEQIYELRRMFRS